MNNQKQFQSRVDIWVGRYEDTKNEAILFYSEKNQRLVWRFGATEKHCRTCEQLNGIVAFASEWETAQVMPQSPPNGLLECGGWQCDCRLEPTDQRRSPDALNIIMQIIETNKSLKGGEGSGNFGHEGRPGEVGKSIAVEEIPVIEEEEIPIILEPVIEIRPVEIHTKEIIIRESDPVDYSKIVAYAAENGFIIPPDELLDKSKKNALKIVEKYKIPASQLPIYTIRKPGAVMPPMRQGLVLGSEGWIDPPMQTRVIGMSSVSPVRVTPHGTLYSLATQNILNVANTQAIAFEMEEDVHDLIHDTVVDNDTIYAKYGGSYEVIFSGIANIAAVPGNKHLEVWLEKNGADVTDTNTRVHIPNDSAETTVVVSFITDLKPGEYIRVMTWGDDTDCQWLATAAAVGPVRPAVPSVIVTMKRVSEYP